MDQPRRVNNPTGGYGNNKRNGDQLPRNRNCNKNNTTSAFNTTGGKFQGQDQVGMKGVVINHSIDHKSPILQQFDVFYKAAKFAAGKINPDLSKSMHTLVGLTDADYTLELPGTSQWTTGGVGDTHKQEMYSQIWLEEKKNHCKDKKSYEEDLKKICSVMYEQLSLGITKKLKAKEDWKTVEDTPDALQLLTHLKEICYSLFEASRLRPGLDALLKVKRFVEAYQDSSKDPTKYVEKGQMQFDVMKAAGVSITLKELTKYCLEKSYPDITYKDYTGGMTEDARKPIIKSVKQLLLSIQIIEGANRKNHQNIQGVLRNEYCLTKDTYPFTPGEAIDLLFRFKSSKPPPKPTNVTAGGRRADKGGNSDKNSEKTESRAAFVTKGEVQEAHQLLMNGIEEGETFGEELLCFVHISNMKYLGENGNNDNHNSWGDEEPSTGSVPDLVKRMTNGYSTCSKDSNDESLTISEESTGVESTGAESPVKSPGVERKEVTISDSTEYLLAQNNGRLGTYLLILDSQATCNVISNKALLWNIREHLENRRVVIHCNAGSVATTLIGELPDFGPCNAPFYQIAKENGHCPGELSPTTIIKGIVLDHNIHFPVLFVKYAQTYKGTGNRMTERTIGAIALGPTGSLQQGGVRFYSLLTGEYLDRHKKDYKLLPIPLDAIKCIERLARQSCTGLTFSDRNNTVYGTDDDDNDDNDDNFLPTTTTTAIPVDDDDSAPVTSDYDDDSTGVDNENLDSTGVDHHNIQTTGVDEQDPDLLGENYEPRVAINGANEDDPHDDVYHSIQTRSGHESIPLVTRIASTLHLNPILNFKRLMIYKNEHQNFMATLEYLDRRVESHYDLLNNYTLAQMNIKEGLRTYRDRGKASVMKEIVDQESISSEDKKWALPILMFMVLKRCGKLKSRGCADGRPQRLWTTKQEVSSPTPTVELIKYILAINALERRGVASFDLPAQFLQTNMDESLYLKITGPLALLLIVDGTQLTVIFLIDDGLITHVKPECVTELLKQLNSVYGKIDPLTITRGKTHEYLGMTIDFSKDGKVTLPMYDYVKKLIDKLPADMKGMKPTAAPEYLFKTSDEDAVKLDKARNEQFYTLVATALYLGLLKDPDEHDWKKLTHLMKYLQHTQHLPLVLKADGNGTIIYMDGSHAVHADMKGHAGVFATEGKGAMYSASTKLKLNTSSSTDV
eukprot:jgi/Psemu1/52590/gm1.52590_g